MPVLEARRACSGRMRLLSQLKLQLRQRFFRFGRVVRCPKEATEEGGT